MSIERFYKKYIKYASSKDQVFVEIYNDGEKEYIRKIQNIFNHISGTDIYNNHFRATLRIPVTEDKLFINPCPSCSKRNWGKESFNLAHEAALKINKILNKNNINLESEKQRLKKEILDMELAAKEHIDQHVFYNQDDGIYNDNQEGYIREFVGNNVLRQYLPTFKRSDNERRRALDQFLKDKKRYKRLQNELKQIEDLGESQFEYSTIIINDMPEYIKEIDNVLDNLNNDIENIIKNDLLNQDEDKLSLYFDPSCYYITIEKYIPPVYKPTYQEEIDNGLPWKYRYE